MMFKLELVEDGTGPIYHNGCYCEVIGEAKHLEKQGFYDVVRVRFSVHSNECLDLKEKEMNINRCWVKPITKVAGLLYD